MFFYFSSSFVRLYNEYQNEDVWNTKTFADGENSHQSRKITEMRKY